MIGGVKRTEDEVGAIGEDGPELSVIHAGNR